MNGRRSTRGFTLIELLITIGLVALLASLIVPASDRLIHRARAATCMSNLRGLGASLNLYLADHHNIMPVLVVARESKTDDEDAIDTVLADYTDDPKAFRCSADAKRLWETTGTSYSWNHLINGQPVPSLNFMGFIRDGARIPVIADKEGWHKHRDVQVNILYADGHVDKDITFVVDE